MSLAIRARVAASGLVWYAGGAIFLVGTLGGGAVARLEWQLIEAERHLVELADPTRLRFVSAETIRARVPEWADAQGVRASAASTRVRISGQPAHPQLDDLATLVHAVREATEPESDAVRVELRSLLVASMLGFERQRDASVDLTIQVPSAGWSPTEDDEAFDGALSAPDTRPAAALAASPPSSTLEVIAAYRILRAAERALAEALARPALAAGPVKPGRWPGGAAHARRLTETRRGLHRLLATPGAAGLEGLGPRGEEGVRTLDVLLARLEGMALESVADTSRCETPLALYAAERAARLRTIREAFANGGLALP